MIINVSDGFILLLCMIISLEILVSFHVNNNYKIVGIVLAFVNICIFFIAQWYMKNKFYPVLPIPANIIDLTVNDAYPPVKPVKYVLYIYIYIHIVCYI